VRHFFLKKKVNITALFELILFPIFFFFGHAHKNTDRNKFDT
jgi:hypothetical protein